jgi:hypothetical protein
MLEPCQALLLGVSGSALLVSIQNLFMPRTGLRPVPLIPDFLHDASSEEKNHVTSCQDVDGG